MTCFCPDCFAEYPLGARTCPRCGASLDATGRDYLEKLIRALQHPAPSVPIQAALVLGGRGDPRAVEPLSEALCTNPEMGFQEAAVEALGRLRDPRAVPALIEALRHSYLSVGARAAWALGAIGTDEARQALEEALNDPSLSVRQAAARALATEPPGKFQRNP